MALTPSTMLPLGTRAPAFSLPDTNGKTVSIADFQNAPALLVMFICNHCPFVKHVRTGLAQLGRDYLPKGVAVVASWPGNGIPVTGSDLRAALDAVLAGKPVVPEQKASIGCNIKWKAGNEPR